MGLVHYRGQNSADKDSHKEMRFINEINVNKISVVTEYILYIYVIEKARNMN